MSQQEQSLVRVLEERLSDWRREADRLEARYGATEAAATVRSLADQLENDVHEWGNAFVSIADAARLSGYSEDHLRRLVREGKVPAIRGHGPKSRIQIRQQDLPRRPRGQDRLRIIPSGGGYAVDEDARDIAQRTGR